MYTVLGSMVGSAALDDSARDQHRAEIENYTAVVSEGRQSLSKLGDECKIGRYSDVAKLLNTAFGALDDILSLDGGNKHTVGPGLIAVAETALRRGLAWFDHCPRGHWIYGNDGFAEMLRLLDQAIELTLKAPVDLDLLRNKLKQVGTRANSVSSDYLSMQHP